MQILDRNTIRIPLDISDPYQPVNIFTAQSPKLSRARGWSLRFAVFFENQLADVSEIESVTFEVKPKDDKTGTPVITETIGQALINSDLSESEWLARSSQHFQVEIDATDTALNLGTSEEVEFHMVITATTSATQRITLGSGPLFVVEDGGVASGNSPAAGDPTYYTAAEVDAKLTGFLKMIGDPGVPLILRSSNSQWQRRIDISDTGIAGDRKTKRT